MSPDRVSRRRFVRATGAAALGAAGVLAGCLGGGGGGGVEGAAETVLAGPGGSLIFEPREVTVAVGETVGWRFESAGHNVSADPRHSDRVSLPDGAEPFASYDGDKKFQTVATGESYAYTFETPGEYDYVCVPHARQGMIGTVVVE